VNLKNLNYYLLNRVFEYKRAGMKELSRLTKEELIKEIKRLRMKEKKPQDFSSHYQRLGKMAHDSVILNNEDGKIIEANGSACRNLGYTYEELLAMNISDIDQGYNANEFKNFWKNKPIEKQYLFETNHRRKDGTVFPVEISATSFIENGQKLITGIARDISERIETEASRLKTKAQLTSAMKITQLGYWEYDIDELIDNRSLPFNGIIHLDHRNKVWNEVREALDQKKQYSIEYKIITKDKKEKWVMDRGNAGRQNMD